MTTDFHVTVFEAIPTPVFVVDRDLCVIDFNAAAARFSDPSVFGAVRLGGRGVLPCVEGETTGCGTSPSCRQCAITNSMKEALAGGSVCRRAVRLRLRRDKNRIEEVDFL